MSFKRMMVSTYSISWYMNPSIITMSGRMCVIKDSSSQPGWFHWSKMELKTTDRDNRMGIKNPFTLLKVTATCNTLYHTAIYSLSLLESIVDYHQLCSQNMSTNKSPPKPVSLAPPSGQSGMHQHSRDNWQSSENSLLTATGKISRFGKQTNQYHPPHGYSCQPSQQLFPGTLQF